MAKKENITEEMAQEKRQKKLKTRKKLKYGGLATTITVIFVAVVVLLNVVVTQIGKRYPNFKLDLTTSNLYEISDETVDYIKNMDKDVEIAISSDEDTFTADSNKKLIAETLEKYRSYSDRITVTYFNTTKDPDILSKYQELYGSTINSDSVIIACGDRIKVYDTETDMFEVDQTTYQYVQYGMASFSDCVTAYKGEQTLTTGIMNVTDSNPKNVAMIVQSNGGTIFSVDETANYDPNYYAYAAMYKLLDENGYGIENVDIITDKLDPESYDVLVLPAPKNDLTEDSVQKIKDFLYNDGNLGKQLIYIADYTQGSTPNLDAFLKEWNVSVDYSYVKDDGSSTSQQVNILSTYKDAFDSAAPLVTITDDEDYPVTLANSDLPIVAPMARPIQTLTANNGRVVSSLLNTSANSYTKALTQTSDGETAVATGTTDTTSDSGAQTVMALCRDQQSTGSELIESDVLVLGSMSLLDANLVTNSSYNNAEYFMGVLNAVCGKDGSIVVASKDLTQTSISATSGQLKSIRLIVVFLIPLVVVAVGVVVGVRRRYR